jgi:hypothetical protein
MMFDGISKAVLKISLTEDTWNKQTKTDKACHQRSLAASKNNYYHGGMLKRLNQIF